MDKDNNNDTSYFNSPDNNNSAGDNHIVYKNKFQPNSRYFTIVIYGLLFVLGAILIFKLIGGFNNTLNIIKYIFNVISPFVIGAFIAFILYPLVRFFYRHLFKEKCHLKSDKLSKYLSILITYIIAIGIITILMVFIIPQLYTSITDIVDKLPVWYNNITGLVNSFEDKHADLGFIDYAVINEQLNNLYPKVISYLTDMLTNLLPYVVNTSMAIVKGLVNLIIAIMVSVYMISDHKNLFYQGKRLIYAILPYKPANTLRNVLRESGRIFTSFIFGKALDSLIIGIICFIAMVIFRFPYAVLISVVVGITNMIPYFGPYIGGAVGFLFILIVSPFKALLFALLILVIQQFDGLYLGPKILGDKTGLKPLWVIFSITVGGSLFGVLGMFLGVPCVAVLGYILNQVVTHFLGKKNITVTPYDSHDRI